MDRWRDRVRDPMDKQLLTFVELAYPVVIRNPDINDEDFRLLAYKLGHNVISTLQIGWLMKEQVDIAEEKGFDHAVPLRGLWERGLKAGLFAELPNDGLDVYRKGFKGN